jgi:hypothetical protein
MMTTATTTATDTILAIDLGKYKSVACLYRSAEDQRFFAFATSRAEFTRPQRQPMPHQVLLGCGQRVEVL